MSKRKKGRPPQSTPPKSSIKPVSRAGARVFAPPILLGALLLFAVQPLIARYLLPWFGGGPGVWTTCMLFFQALLLGGYLYAHVSVRYLPTRGQIVLHVILVLVALAMIPIIPSDRWKPVDANDPVGRILLLLGVTIGLPYFVLSATSPLLQAWFVKAEPGVSPYRLFALSNLGSLLALIGYPLILEPFFTRRQQAWIWSIGLIAFALTCIACAIYVWRRRDPEEVPSTAAPVDSRGTSASSVESRKPAGTIALWVALPMLASVLLLAITNTMTEDVASMPLLWVIPLALYLLTFVIAFDGARWYPRRAVLTTLPLCTLWLMRLQWLKTDAMLLEQLIGYSVGLFALCLFCHGELARLKPAASRLTSYYLAISVGGAVGGAVVAIVAPHVFNRLLELPLVVIAIAGLSWLCLRNDPLPGGRRWATVFSVTAIALPLGLYVIKPWSFRRSEVIVERSRNFYGTLVVTEFGAESADDPANHIRALNHGSTSHGSQFLNPVLRREPSLYYGRKSGVGLTLEHFPRKENRKVGFVGLGVGTLSAYGRPGDTFRYYEINPDVVRIAQTRFTFLSDSAAKNEIIVGDARLMLEREVPQGFDVLVLDAFSGDAIPTHLLTAEAFDIYRRHLTPGGVIAVHISNRSIDLIQVMVRQTERLGWPYAIINHDEETTGILVSRWILMTPNEAFLNEPAIAPERRIVHPNPEIDLWTDDHTPLMQVIRFVPPEHSAPPALR